MCYGKKMQTLNRSSSKNELKHYQTSESERKNNQTVHKETFFWRKYDNWKEPNLLAIFSLMLDNFLKSKI